MEGGGVRAGVGDKVCLHGMGRDCKFKVRPERCGIGLENLNRVEAHIVVRDHKTAMFPTSGFSDGMGVTEVLETRGTSTSRWWPIWKYWRLATAERIR